MGIYRVAQVCLNGHVITDAADAHPDLRAEFCSKCGEQTITQCPACSTNIRGKYQVGEVVRARSGHDPAPAFCYACGHPFPWTERKLKAAVDLMKTGGRVSDAELEQFVEDLDELTKDSPMVPVAALRVKSLMDKVGNPAAKLAREVLEGLVSEAAMKTIREP